jgi:hypothetical protein
LNNNSKHNGVIWNTELQKVIEQARLKLLNLSWLHEHVNCK